MLDDAVAGDGGEEAGGESATEKKMKASLLSTLRRQFEQQEGDSPKDDAELDAKVPPQETPLTNGNPAAEKQPTVEDDGDVVMVDAPPVDKPMEVDGLTTKTVIAV